jgi:hypothetical protein
MQERVSLLGGRFQIQSRPGVGSLIIAEVPLSGNSPDQGRVPIGLQEGALTRGGIGEE